MTKLPNSKLEKLVQSEFSVSFIGILDFEFV